MMPRFFLIKSLVVMLMLVSFGKIYQQNCVIRLQYEKQRLERSYLSLMKKRNAALMLLAQTKNLSELRNEAETVRGMQALPISRLITFTGRLS